MANKLELTWVGKEKELKVEPRILIKNPALSNTAQDSNTENMLIHGDNLLALKALESKFAGQVKCIYIDPPYNTGKAFEHYDDNLEHSIWLNLMSERIKILRNLLTEDGFFVCHIDDSESHYLKAMCDEIFGRKNYLTTFYVQVRYPNKTLAEDSDYQKVIEQCFVYAKNRFIGKINRPKVEYDVTKFTWKITELETGETLKIGNKNVTIFKPYQYQIDKISPCIDGLKETWATGSLARVSASAGEFFELYLAERKSIDGLGCLYKVEGIGEDGLGFRYISGPKKETANKGKFYSGIPLARRQEILQGKSFRYLPVSNFYDMAGNFGNCRLEGGIDFKGGKKPEILLKTILEYFSQEGDLVLDSFLGSGTTAAVAHKLKRKWIGVELGDHAYSLCKPRLDNVINGDKTGISKSIDWQGGGGYKFYELAPTLILQDDFGQEIINPEYNAEMLASAVAMHEGYTYAPDENCYFKQAYNGSNAYLYVTTRHIDKSIVNSILTQLQDNEYLIVVCKSFDSNAAEDAKNITLKKIPQSLLDNCEFGKDDYKLNIVNPPIYEEEETEDNE